VLALGGLLAAAAVWHVRRHPDPIVKPRLLTVRRLRLGVTGIFVYYVGFAIQMLGSTLLLTDAWQFSPLGVALGIAPGPLLSSLLAPFAGRLTARFGARAMVTGGAALFAITGTWSLLAVSATPNYAQGVLPALLCWGISNAMLQPTLFAVADAAPDGETASASALLTMARQLGSAVGVALLVAVLANQPAGSLSGLRWGWAIAVAAAVLTMMVGARMDAPRIRTQLEERKARAPLQIPGLRVHPGGPRGSAIRGGLVAPGPPSPGG
jgi:MFS family permease